VAAGETASANLVTIANTYETCFGDQTAWAYGGEYSVANWVYVKDANWGWTNGPLAAGHYTFDLYAGAGQNDISKGMLVGNVIVDYAGGFVTVTYEITKPGVYLGDVHLWVGCEPLPKVTRGKKDPAYTNDPGQFPVKGGYDFNAGDRETEWSSDPIPVTCSNIYVAAHAVVWLPVDCPD
jgi:hypothetical protein